MTMISARLKWTEQTRFEGTATSGHTVITDADSKVGNSPMELVLIALCGCTATDLVTILRKKREPFISVEVSAEAEKAPEPPRVFTAIKLLYRVSGQVSRKSVEDAVRLSEEKYCSVSAMLSKTAKVTYQIELDSP
jgi:putative redox protein